MEDWELAETPMQIPASPPANPSPPANQCDSGGRDQLPDIRTAETPAFCRYREAIEWQLLLERGSTRGQKAVGD
jgi:hypothetical protein